MRNGRASRRALTAASLDLAARGLIAFRAESGGLLAGKPKIGILTGTPVEGDPDEHARMLWARNRPIDAATAYLGEQLDSIAGSAAYIEPTDMTQLGAHVGTFNTKLETHVVEQGWFAERPGQATVRWFRRGFLVIVVGIAGVVIGFKLPADGVVAVGGALIAAGVALLLLAGTMPSRTMPGAMIRAMLEAYRRTLEKTMEQARSMGEVAATLPRSR